MSDAYRRDIDASSKIDAVPRILEVICRTTGLGFSAVARVTESHWVACAVRDEIAFGIRPGGELVIGTTICDEIRQDGNLIVIDNVDSDEVYCNHATPRMYGFKSYISVPIRLKDGEFFGTLCAIDPRPARVNNDETIKMFQLFSELIAHHLDAHHRLDMSEQLLLNERETAQLREQFIAVLGHDLRNPLGAISSGVELLSQLPKGDDANEVREMVQSSINRMTELIDNVLDFARGRLGGGLSFEHHLESGLDVMLLQVVRELQSSWPQRPIESIIEIHRPFKCNGARLAQMLSNLLANALVHGDPQHPVLVTARTADDGFALSVTNRGSTISEKIIGQLFQPFVRGSVQPGQQGLGLGLYIASEIARTHQGTLHVTSADGQTRFVFQMPIK